MPSVTCCSLMSSQDEQIQQRAANLDELAKLGVEIYPRTFERRHTISELVDALRRAHARRARGRARSRRSPAAASSRSASFGKANFLVLSDGRAKIQVYIRQDSLPELDFKIFKLLDFGDWVGVEGRLFRTKTNELTIWASRLHFLAKCLLPLPEKWHGLTDVEIRYRQRYLDLIVNPDSRRVFETRSRVVAAIREFMTARGYLEVETPMMQPIAGGALARPFVTHHNALDMDLYLRIAPELYLKRLTVGGIERVFEINRNFRNEGISTQHNPEFTMMEFYEAYADYQELMRDDRGADRDGRAAGDRHRPGHVRRASDLAAGAVRAAVAARGGARGGVARGCGREVDRRRPARSRRRPRRIAARAGHRGRSRRTAPARSRPTIFEALCEDRLDPADLRLRLSDRGVAAVEAEAGRSRHGRALRALHRRLRGGERLQRAERSGRAAAALRGAARQTARAAISRRTRWTRTTSARSSTACRRPAAKASASIGW